LVETKNTDSPWVVARLWNPHVAIAIYLPVLGDFLLQKFVDFAGNINHIQIRNLPASYLQQVLRDFLAIKRKTESAVKNYLPDQLVWELVSRFVERMLYELISLAVLVFKKDVLGVKNAIP
jgi:hypothetical protein